MTDHLGNVLATVSDKRRGIDINGDGVIDIYRASIPAAYDYYPFGMLIPGRYIDDTTKHCALVTSTYMTPVVTTTYAYPWGDRNISLIGTPVTAVTGDKLYQITANAGEGFTYAIPVTDGEAPLHVLNFSSTSVSGSYLLSVVHADTPYEVYTAVPMSSAGTVALQYTVPSSTNAVLNVTAVYGGSVLTLRPWYTTTTTYQPTTATTTICDKESDNYRYGYNGKLKDNEWAGIGNSMDFGARGLDTRTGRFRSLDPDKAKYPFQSPYCYANNTPIQAVDKEGKGPGYAALLFLAKQTNSTIAVGTSASVSFGVGASVAAGIGVDPKGNVALFASASLGSLDNTIFNIDKLGLGASVNGTVSILPFKDVKAISGAGFSIGGSAYSPSAIGGGITADFSVSNANKVSFQGITASVGVGIPGGTVGVGGAQATNAILLSGSDYKTIVDGKWDKTGVANAIAWDRALNNDNMNSPSGVWNYSGKEMIFTKVEGQENTYSIDIKLNYSRSTTGKGAAEGQRDTQTSQTVNTGITIKKTDDFTYQSTNLK